MIATVTKNDLIALGFSEGTSKRIIRQGNNPRLYSLSEQANWYYTCYYCYRITRF
ncbi:Domain of uncharacterised function (DUF3173) [Streptococcus pneumoniae]|nr:Domain of uncharacterised function (DUF3173) [Streptococcus pneumoniae]VRF12497.1 Domain of uncharacterised function (DUF3173) [Streptococcus pneumoniae]